MTLDDRKKKILESIIKDYVETAEPIGSRAVVKKHGLKISAATARNEMADLEAMGYLEQPHTSAGRIPSETGFRYYVDCMMEKEELAEKEIEVLYRGLTQNSRELEDLITKIGSFISQVTNYASFVVVPSVKLNEFKQMEIVLGERGKAIIFIITDMGVIMHRRIEIPLSLENEDVKLISRLFNKVFAGKKLGEIRKSNLQLLRDNLQQHRKLIDRTLEAIDSLVEDSGEEKVIISGTLNMLNEPEFKDIEKLKRILSILEEDILLKDIIPHDIDEEVTVKIGRENKIEEIKEMSLVFTGYNTFGDLGKIGVIGPIRMEYWKAVGTIDSVRDIIEDIINKFF